MGSARWDPSAWNSHATQTRAKTQQQIFTQSSIHKDLDPTRVKFRESVDSDKNPNSTPIIIAVDETGSMGVLAEAIIKHGLGVIMQEIYDRKPVSDPHLMCMAVGDGRVDRAALQVTQFEASIVLAEQVKNFYLEGEGGGNGGESYGLAWLFAAHKTVCDAQRKRSRKGYLFTIGDEPPHLEVTRDEAKRFAGITIEQDIQLKDLLATLQPHWEVFHLIVKPGTYPNATVRWRNLLAERAIHVTDHEKLAEVIVSTIQVIEGHDVNQVINSWSGNTSLVVRDAVGALAQAGGVPSGIVRM